MFVLWFCFVFFPVRGKATAVLKHYPAVDECRKEMAYRKARFAVF